MMFQRLSLFAICPIALACGGESARPVPTGQIVLYVTTDAPLPPAPGEPTDPNAPPALFDRLRVDVFSPGASEPCSDCSHDFELDRLRVREGQASIGIVPPPGVSGYVARARLFRSITVKRGEPPPLSTIDVFAALPVVQRDGILKVTIALRVQDVGHTLGSLNAPTEPLTGEPDFSLIGTWSKAERVPCKGAARPGEVCVPGGAYWMGHPYSSLHEEGADSSVSRLVVLSPFFVDVHEVTVAEYRASKLATLEGGSSIDPMIGSADSPPKAAELTPYDEHFYCTYSDAPLASEKSRENLPVNCISWNAASAFCAAQGKKLPSEAEYEYLAGALKSDLFVWGSDTSAAIECADTVWGRGGVREGWISTCRAPDEPGGPLSAGSGKLDRLLLNGQEIVDLMSNVSEWTRDHWNRIDEPCWAGRALLENPQCNAPSTLDLASEGELHTVKGQGWTGIVSPAARRIAGENLRPVRGFRCVRGDR